MYFAVSSSSIKFKFPRNEKILRANENTPSWMEVLNSQIFIPKEYVVI